MFDIRMRAVGSHEGTGSIVVSPAKLCLLKSISPLVSDIVNDGSWDRNEDCGERE